MDETQNRFFFRVTQAIQEVGRIVVFFMECFQLLIRAKFNRRAIIEQIYEVGVHSIGITLTAGVFVGAIMALQINLQLKDFGAQGFLGGLATSTTLRNVGPVLIAFLLSGKVGAYTSAELGNMQVTDQLNALKLLGINPIETIILPRMLAVIISSFLLLIIGLMVTIVGGMVFSTSVGVNALNYINNIPRLVSGWSLGVGIVKSFCFGLMIATISCYKGYNADGGSRGVGKAVKSCAVTTLVLIILVDFSVSLLAEIVQEWFGVGYL